MKKVICVTIFLVNVVISFAQQVYVPGTPFIGGIYFDLPYVRSKDMEIYGPVKKIIIYKYDSKLKFDNVEPMIDSKLLVLEYTFNKSGYLNTIIFNRVFNTRETYKFEFYKSFSMNSQKSNVTYIRNVSGHLEFIEEMYKIKTTSTGKMYESFDDEYRYVFEYNQFGQLVEYSKFARYCSEESCPLLENSTELKYNSMGELIEINEYDYVQYIDGIKSHFLINTLSHKEIIHWESGKIKDICEYHGDGTLYNKSIFSYDNKGYKIKTIGFNSSQIFECTIDSHGNWIKIIGYDIDENGIKNNPLYLESVIEYYQ